MRGPRFATGQGRVHQLSKQRVRSVGAALELGVRLRADPVRMIVELDELDQATIRRDAAAAQSSGFELRLQLGVELPAVAVTLADHGLAVRPVHAGVRFEDGVVGAEALRAAPCPTQRLRAPTEAEIAPFRRPPVPLTVAGGIYQGCARSEQGIDAMAIRPEQHQTTAPAGRVRPKALPNSGGYGLKRLLLGPAIPTANLVHERLGKPTALAVFASDNLSSVAYATEEILKVAVLAGIGVAAFTIVMPITVGILAVLGILLFSYRQTIKAYPSAGGAYIVTKDNFGLLPAQIAGVALLTDYVLTVSVSVAAGIAAVTSAAPGLYPYRVWMSVFFIWFIAWGNLRGVRESGRMFAVPTYFFIVDDVPDARGGPLPGVHGGPPHRSRSPLTWRD